MRAETGSSRPSVWDDRPRIDKAGQNRRSDGWKSDVYCQPRQEIYTGGLAKVTLNLRGGVKASISQNAKGEINVERTETKKQKLTE